MARNKKTRCYNVGLSRASSFPRFADSFEIGATSGKLKRKAPNRRGDVSARLKSAVNYNAADRIMSSNRCKNARQDDPRATRRYILCSGECGITVSGYCLSEFSSDGKGKGEGSTLCHHKRIHSPDGGFPWGSRLTSS